jgi:phosphodiesterase/alkaline phosphatase D-like protein
LGIRLRLVVAVLLGVSLLAPNTLAGLALGSPVLTRYPYLTDATSTSVLVNFATNTPSSTATPVVTWGAAGGSCNTNTVKVNAGITITVGTATEYQYKGLISGLSPNTSYCYRVNQSNSNPDLLGSDASPTFTSALTAGAGSSYSFAVVGDFGAGTIDENKVLAQVAKNNASFIVTAGDNAYNSGSQSDYGDLSAGNVFGARRTGNRSAPGCPPSRHTATTVSPLTFHIYRTGPRTRW